MIAFYNKIKINESKMSKVKKKSFHKSIFVAVHISLGVYAQS